MEPLGAWIGQDRAIDAIRMAAKIPHSEFNLFVLGTRGIGRKEATQALLEQAASSRKPPNDWVYVNNFDDPQNPQAIELPPGQGSRFRTAMEALIDDLANEIPALFDSDEYQTRRKAIEETYAEHHEEAMNTLVESASQRGAAILRTPMGLAVAATRAGEVLKPEEFEKLDQAERDQIEAVVTEIQAELEALLADVPKQQKQHRADVENLNAELVTTVVDQAVNDALHGFFDEPKIALFIKAAQQDITENAELFLTTEDRPQAGAFPVATTRHLARPQFQRYVVNLVVSNPAEGLGAPIIEEALPSLGNLIGRIEHASQMGTLVTNFTMIKGGALHRANGGYLILDAQQLLSEPLAWEALKHSLRDGEISIYSANERYSLVSTASLKPDPIPLDVRVVLIGDRRLYYLLSALGPEFSGLFKLQADFNDELDWDNGATEIYARLVASLAKKSKLKPLTPDGMACIITESSRLAGGSERLTLNVSDLSDIPREASYWAEMSGASSISAVDVDKAIAERDRRNNRIPEMTRASITRETVLIDTEGSRVGQINALSVLEIGGHRFGRPSRVTVRVRMGVGKVIDIEREADLGGPLHSKGMMILQGYLGTTFVPDMPLSLLASIVFEQSYGGVDGDSASAAELIALLSALAEVPINQALAITGSVNQFGEVQAIGGVNEKIEGFFDICADRGLTGKQGVIIPHANIKHLALRNRVVGAVEAGKFNIYPINHVSVGTALLTGTPAGEARNTSGNFPKGSVYGKAETRLREFALARKKFASKAKPTPKGAK